MRDLHISQMDIKNMDNNTQNVERERGAGEGRRAAERRSETASPVAARQPARRQVADA
jgi:hypothetical protein